MKKRRIFWLLVLGALLAIFLPLLSRKPQQLFQPPLPLALSVQQQSLKFKVEEALSVDLDGDGRSELVLREASTKHLFFAQWQGNRWAIEPLPIPSKSALLHHGSSLDTKLIPPGTISGKNLLKPLDFRCLPILLSNGQVITLQRDRKGRWLSRVLVHNAKFVLAGDLDGNGRQNDLVVAVLPNRLLWFVAQKGVASFSLQDEIRVSRHGKALPWGRLDYASITHGQSLIVHGNANTLTWALWHNRLVTDVQVIKRGDLDGDGVLDEAMSCFGTHQLQVWLSKTQKTINLPVNVNEWTVGDLDNDGRDEIVGLSNNQLICWKIQPSGKVARFNFSLPMKFTWTGTSLNIGDVDGDGLKEAILPFSNKPPLAKLWGVLVRLQIVSISPPNLLLVQRTEQGWKLQEAKVLSTRVPRRFALDTPEGIGYFGGRWWLLASSNCVTTITCFTCRLKGALASLRGGYFICPHSYNIHWQETHFWTVREGKAIETFRLNAILAHEFLKTTPKGIDLDGDGKGEAVLTRTLGNNAVFVARYRNERWEVGKVERPCRLVSLSLSSKPRPCLIAVWEDGTITQIGVAPLR